MKLPSVAVTFLNTPWKRNTMMSDSPTGAAALLMTAMTSATREASTSNL